MLPNKRLSKLALSSPIPSTTTIQARRIEYSRLPSALRFRVAECYARLYLGGHLHAIPSAPGGLLISRRNESLLCLTLPLSINTDNPLTFSTCLVDEYTYLHAALLEAGIPASAASAWLDRARTAGWNSRFSHPLSADPVALHRLVQSMDD